MHTNSLAGKAIDYAIGPMECYLADVRVEIDSNLVENAIRPMSTNWQTKDLTPEAQALRRLKAVA